MHHLYEVNSIDQTFYWYNPAPSVAMSDLMRAGSLWGLYTGAYVLTRDYYLSAANWLFNKLTSMGQMTAEQRLLSS